MNKLSRNCPVAFVVGAGGFLGSHLVEKLLEKNIQVVGVDDLSSGQKEYLLESAKNKNFHFLQQSAEDDFPEVFTQLDYAFFILPENLRRSVYLRCLDNFLQVCEKAAKSQAHFPKIVLVSSVKLYDEHADDCVTLREAEQRLANYSAENKANARIIRLETVFGPRMHFRGDDPLLKLLVAAVTDNIQKISTPLDFSTRAIFVVDAINLLIKAVMHGATAQKLYDGAVSPPVKLAEVKQVLLDPLWHESRGFTPTELPPWPTPNLLKTEKELVFKPKTTLVEALKQTVVYLKENPQILHEEGEDWKEESEIAGKEMEDNKDQNQEKVVEDGEVKKGITSMKVRIPIDAYVLVTQRALRLIGAFMALGVVIYALFYPLGTFVWGGRMVSQQLSNAYEGMLSGDTNLTTQKVEQMKATVKNMETVARPGASFLQRGPLGNFLGQPGQLLDLFAGTSESLDQAVSGFSLLDQGLKITSGEKEGDFREVFNSAYYKLEQAENGLNQQLMLVERLKAGKLGSHASTELSAWEKKMKDLKHLVSKEKLVALTIPQILGKEDNQSFLVLLLDNRNLRRGGGVPKIYAEVKFNQGKLVDLQVGSVASLDQNLSENLLPPVEVKTDMGEKRWLLKDSNIEPDFIANARVAEWFYRKEKNTGVLGVVTLDLKALGRLITTMGAINLEGSGGKIEESNLLVKLSQTASEEKFLSSLLKETLNRMVYLSSGNILKLTETLSPLGKEKHWQLYLNDPQAQTLMDKNVSSVFPRQPREVKGEKESFLAITETNLNPLLKEPLQKEVRLQSQITSGGGVKHQLAVDYSNGSQPSSTKIRVYLSAGSKLTKAKLGTEDIFKKVTTFTDYGRAGYSLTLDLKAGEKKELALEYEDIKQLNFKDNKLEYKLNIFKQLGSLGGKVDFTLDYPSTIKSISPAENPSLGRRVSLSSDLTEDRFFEISLEKTN